MFSIIRNILGITKFEKPTNSFIHIDSTILKPLDVGDLAPNFTLRNALNENINLYAILEEQMVILSFFRGAWCLHCNTELTELQNELHNIQGHGVRLIAITPDSPAINAELSKKKGLDYDIVFDHNSDVAHLFDIVTPVQTDVVRKYITKMGKQLFQAYPNGYEVPLPATYIIDKNRTIVYCYVETDFTMRIHPSILTEIITIKKARH